MYKILIAIVIILILILLWNNVSSANEDNEAKETLIVPPSVPTVAYNCYTNNSLQCGGNFYFSRNASFKPTPISYMPNYVWGDNGMGACPPLKYRGVPLIPLYTLYKGKNYTEGAILTYFLVNDPINKRTPFFILRTVSFAFPKECGDPPKGYYDPAVLSSFAMGGGTGIVGLVEAEQYNNCLKTQQKRADCMDYGGVSGTGVPQCTDTANTYGTDCASFRDAWMNKASSLKWNINPKGIIYNGRFYDIRAVLYDKTAWDGSGYGKSLITNKDIPDLGLYGLNKDVAHANVIVNDLGAVPVPVPKYVYFLDAGPGYINGWTKAGSESKCAAYGGRSATVDELKKAGSLGFQRCSTSWLRDGAGLYMQTSSSGCGAAGYNAWPSGDVNKKYSALCYGANPNISVPMTKIADN